MKIALGVVGFIIVAVLIKLIWSSVQSRARPEIGLVDGTLRACPDKPNCVSSLASDERHRIGPLHITGDPGASMARAAAAVTATGGTIVQRDDRYLHAEFTTRLMRYIDDVELLLDADIVHVRSASRVGHSDLGANRKRVERLRRRLELGR